MRAGRRRADRVDPQPPPSLVERWTYVDGVKVVCRESRVRRGSAMMHVHGFGLSGRYLVPTAERLADEFYTLVPDLPGFGRSGRVRGGLDLTGLAHAVAGLLSDRGVESATLVGNSMGCPVICEFARLYPERIDRAILVSPAGGMHNQPFPRAMTQIARDGFLEPVRLFPVVVPDYLRFGVPSTRRLFQAMAEFPALQRLLELEIPTLAVIGARDPLMPGPERVREIASKIGVRTSLVVIGGAAHAINFSHPGELAHVIRLFMADQPIVDDPDSPGESVAVELHRGAELPAGS